MPAEKTRAGGRPLVLLDRVILIDLGEGGR